VSGVSKVYLRRKTKDEMPAANVKVSKSVGSVGSVESIKSIKSVLKNRSEYLKCRDIMI
jgi:hypothetical protein